MLNRLYIVIGVLAIVVIAAAFIVPRFIQWGDYRGRMEMIASETLGAPVEIVGDIEFSLLPQPQLKFDEVRVGAPDAPVLTVGHVEAEFSLIDFLRDRYHITRLVLDRPSLGIRIDADGQVVFGIALADEVSTSNVSVAKAQIVDGAVRLQDERAGESLELTDIDGDLRMDALRGPFSFQGAVLYGGSGYTARLATSALDDAGGSQLSVYVRPRGEGFSLAAEGRLTQGPAPAFAGTMTYTQSPPVAANGKEVEDAGRGNLVVTGQLQVSPARVLLSSYTIVPDDNRAGTRLTGAAEITLGSARSFNAVISGGVVGLPPRDATADQAAVPYELVRLMGELPVPAIPGMAGTIGVDIAEMDLRAIALRNVRLDASTDGTQWELASFSAQLPGNAILNLSGILSAQSGKPDFVGSLGIRTKRLDALAQLWRRPADVGALFNLPGSLTSRLSLVGETVSLSNAVLTIDQQAYPFSAEIGFAAATRHLNFRAALGALDGNQSAALLALLPNAAADSRFGVTFPKGKFDVSAEALTIDGVAGEGLVASGFWEGGVLAMDRLAATQIGGVALDAKLTAFGSFARPELSGTASIAVRDANAPGLARFFDAVVAPEPIRDWLERSLPYQLALRLDAPSGEGGQSLGVTGRLGAASLRLDAQLGLGIVRALQGPMAIRLDLRADDAAALTGQLGLGDASLTPEGQPMHVAAVIEGTAANSFESTLRLEGGGESLAFSGNVVASDLLKLGGNGNLQVNISDLSPLVDRLGAGGLWLPAIAGNARIDFEGLDSIRLRDINGTAGGEKVTGELRWARASGAASVGGALSFEQFSPTGLLALATGPAAAMNLGTGIWPDGPVATGNEARTTSGRVDVSAARIALDDTPLLTEAHFTLGWDASEVRVRDFSATLGGGKATGELGICCAGPLPQLQLSGRFALDDVSFSSLVPAPVARAISARVDAAAKFEGTGDSFFEALAAMTGEGSYTFDGLSVEGVDPAAFSAIASLDEVLDMDPADLTAAVIDQLGDSAFTVPSVSGSFTVAGGVLRSPNLAVVGEAARLFGSTNLRLADLGLSGGFAMTPTQPTGPDGMLTAANASIVASFGGTLPSPERTYDVGGVVDTIMVRAYELEVARLEQLQAEDEARQRLAAEERARVVAEETARKAAAEEAARLAAEEEARRQAEAEATRRAEEEEAARRAAAAAAAQADRPPPQVQTVPQLQPGFNLNFIPEPPANQF